jgi:hypothetical protein
MITRTMHCGHPTVKKTVIDHYQECMFYQIHFSLAYYIHISFRIPSSFRQPTYLSMHTAHLACGSLSYKCTYNVCVENVIETLPKLWLYVVTTVLMFYLAIKTLYVHRLTHTALTSDTQTSRILQLFLTTYKTHPH